jgi:transposase-like protein
MSLKSSVVRKAVTMRKRGAALTDIVQSLKISMRSVSRIMDEHGLARTRSSHLHGQTVNAIKRRIDQGLSNSQIMRCLGVSNDAVQRVRLKF